MRKHFQEALAEASKSRVLAFPEAEFAQRQRRLRESMAASKVDLVFVTSPESIFYLTGFQCEWYQAQSGRAFPPTSGVAFAADRADYIHFETPSEAILSHLTTVSKDIRIFPLEARRDGRGFILQELRAAGMLKGTVGLERYNYRPNPIISEQYVAGFQEAGLKVVDATDLLRNLRHVKSPLEMECIEEASRIADIGMRAAQAAIRPGATELEVFGEAIAAMTKAGGEFPGILPPVMAGLRANCSHPIATRKVIQKGERVNVDVSGVYNRYHSNMCRGFHVGEPSKAVLDFHNRSVGVFRIVEEMIRPGLEVRELLATVKAYYEEQGLLPESYWSGGYELGIAFPPDWVGAFIYDESITQPGETFQPMTVANHECVFFGPEKSGLAFTIETMIFGQDRARLASSFPRELQIVAA